MTERSALSQTTVPPGTVGLLANRISVHTSTTDVLGVLDFVDPDTGGLVLVPRAGTGNNTLKHRLGEVRERGYLGPIAWDPAGYRHREATIEAPFVLPAEHGLTGPERVTDQIDTARMLGADVVGTSTGWIDVADPDVLKKVCEFGDRIDRDDFVLTLPLDIGYLNDAHIEQTVAVLGAVRKPIALILGGQFDPLSKSPRQLISNLRMLARGCRHVAILRTDFAAFDLMAHGAFAAAIGSGTGFRHAVDPREEDQVRNIKDESPSVLIPELHSWWKGSKIARVHGRYGVRRCFYAPCGNESLGRFVAREHRDAARTHDLGVWTEWARLLLAAPDRGEFWQTKCAAAVDEHVVFGEQVGQPDLKPSPTLKAWATLPSDDRSTTTA